MNLNTKIADLFKAKDASEKLRDTNSTMELKTIEHQLNLHLKNRQGLKFKKVSIAYDKAYDETKFSDVINDEIENKTANKKWKALPIYLKWKYIENYLIEENNTDINYAAELKKKLLNNTLDVKYEDKKVIQIL